MIKTRKDRIAKHMVAALDTALNAVSAPLSIKTEDVEIWMKQKTQFLILREMFTNYFSGAYIWEGIPVHDRDVELLEIKFKKYLALYDVLSFGWGEILAGFSGIEMPVSSPGAALEFILNGDAESAMAPRDSLPNAGTLYRAFRQHRKCEALEAQGKLSDDERKKLDTFVRRVKTKVPATKEYPEHRLFEDAVIDICLHSKKKSIKNFAAIFQEHHQKHMDCIGKRLRATL